MSFLRHWEIFRSDELAVVGEATDWLSIAGGVSVTAEMSRKLLNEYACFLHCILNLTVP